MVTIDAQVHAYERDHPGRPWHGVLAGPPEVTGDQMVAAMDAVGVDGALLVSVHTMYRFDPSYAIEVHAAHPDRFALVKPVDTNDGAVVEEIEAWAAREGTVGIRIMMNDEVSDDPADPGITAVLSAAGRLSLPVNLLCWDRQEQAAAVAAAHPDTRLVIDHLGLQQPFDPPPRRNPSPTCPRFWRWRRTTTWRSRFPVPAPSRTSPIPMTTSGTRCCASSKPSASSAVSGEPTGPGRSGC